MVTIAGGFSHLSTMFSNRCTITTSLFQRAFSWDRDAKKELPTTLPRTPYKVTLKNTNKKKIHVFGFILTIWIDVVYQIIVPFRCHFITMTSLKIPIINGKTLCYNYAYDVLTPFEMLIGIQIFIIRIKLCFLGHLKIRYNAETCHVRTLNFSIRKRIMYLTSK